MDSTINYHHYRTDLQPYNVLYHKYLDLLQPVITVEQIYSYATFLRHGYMDSPTNYDHCRIDLQL